MLEASCHRCVYATSSNQTLGSSEGRGPVSPPLCLQDYLAQYLALRYSGNMERTRIFGMNKAEVERASSQVLGHQDWSGASSM